MPKTTETEAPSPASAALLAASRVVYLHGEHSKLLSGDEEAGVPASQVLPALLAKGWRISAALPAHGTHGAYLFLVPPAL